MVLQVCGFGKNECFVFVGDGRSVALELVDADFIGFFLDLSFVEISVYCVPENMLAFLGPCISKYALL